MIEVLKILRGNALKTIFIFAFIGGIVATLNRLLHIVNNPDSITRHDNGKPKVLWCLFNNTVRILVAMLVSAFVGVVILTHVSFLDETSKFAIAGASAIMGEPIWNIIGTKIKNFVEKWLDDNTDNKKSRRRR